jgi:hypothetical protein
MMQAKHGIFYSPSIQIRLRLTRGPIHCYSYRHEKIYLQLTGDR